MSSGEPYTNTILDLHSQLEPQRLGAETDRLLYCGQQGCGCAEAVLSLVVRLRDTVTVEGNDQ